MRKSNTFLLAITIFLFALIVRIPLLLNTSEMFDEFAVAGYGRIYWGGIKNLNFSKNIWSINYEHPPVAKYIYGAGVFLEEKLPLIQERFDSIYHPDKRYFLARFFSVLIGSFTILAVFLIGRQWFNKWVGLFSALFLSLMPHFIAHNTIAGLEAPQALFATALVFFYVEGLQKNNRKYLFLSVASFALLFLTKFSGAFYVFFYLATLLLLKKHPWQNKDLITWHILGIFIFALSVFLLWPWLWSNPLNILESFKYFRNAHSGEYFMGSLGQPGWYYYFTSFFATTPPAILFLFAIVIVLLFYKKIRTQDKKLIMTLLLWFFTPFLASFLGLKQDGIRYVFSYFPPLALLSGYGFHYFINRLRGQFYKVVFFLIVFTSILWSLFKFFPYYLDYYNILVGGVETVYEKKLFDYDWWGEGTRQGVEYVNRNYNDVSVYPFLRPAHTSPHFKEGLSVLKSLDLENPPEILVISEYFFYYPHEFNFLDRYELVHMLGINKDVILIRIYELEKQ